jgi:putative FmdB family regulatory protein
MPTYVYRCPACGWADEIVKPMSESDAAETCRQCSTPMDRDFSAEVRTTNSDYDNGHEIHSDSLAIHPSQIAEHRQRYPNVPLDSACRPVFTSVKQREKYLNARGVLKISHNREY